jgi:hypothetical protein
MYLMPSIWNRSGPKGTAASARTRIRTRIGRLTCGLAASLTALGLAAVLPAAVASAAPPPPAAGVAPGAAAESAGLIDLFYTAADGTVWTLTAGGTPGTPTQVGTGKVIGGVSAFSAAGALVVFGEGTDHQLWWATRVHGAWGAWTSLGGNLSSKPGAVFRGPSSADYSVFVRGTDGAVWARDHSAAGWGAWHSIGGQLLAGTGPSAAFLGGTFVLVVGTNKELFIAHAGVTGFSAAGGQTTTSPALTAITGALVGFARGTDNAAYFHRFLSTSPGWHLMGGNLTAGLAAVAAGSTTYTFGLGTDSQVYRNIGTWTAYPPTFSGWVKVTG